MCQIIEYLVNNINMFRFVLHTRKKRVETTVNSAPKIEIEWRRRSWNRAEKYLTLNSIQSIDQSYGTQHIKMGFGLSKSEEKCYGLAHSRVKWWKTINQIGGCFAVTQVNLQIIAKTKICCQYITKSKITFHNKPLDEVNISKLWSNFFFAIEMWMENRDNM